MRDKSIAAIPAIVEVLDTWIYFTNEKAMDEEERPRGPISRPNCHLSPYQISRITLRLAGIGESVEFASCLPAFDKIFMTYCDLNSWFEDPDRRLFNVFEWGHKPHRGLGEDLDRKLRSSLKKNSEFANMFGD